MILETKSAIRALLLGIFLMSLGQFSGAFPIMNYTSTIFQASGSYFTPNVSSIFVSLTQMLGSCTSFLLVEKFGRKVSSNFIWSYYVNESQFNVLIGFVYHIVSWNRLWTLSFIDLLILRCSGSWRSFL